MGAFVLTKMKETAEAYLGHPVSKAVITVPGRRGPGVVGGGGGGGRGKGGVVGVGSGPCGEGRKWGGVVRDGPRQQYSRCIAA